MSSSYNRTIVVIVSAFSSGGERLPQLFIGRGYDCVHITTRREWEMKWIHNYFNAKHFIKNIILENDEDLPKAITELQQYHVRVVLPGCESGVMLADRLQHHFQLPKNDLSLSLARRDKFLMIETIKQHNLSPIEQFRSGSLANIIAWFTQKNRSRVVVKPLSSASSDGVFYCHDVNELTNAYQANINIKDVFGDVNAELLIQDFIPGDEYIINLVSCDGLHQVVDVWKGVSENNNLVSNDIYAELIHPSDAAYEELVLYVIKVLKALGIANGAAHVEVRLTPQGPCLIEVGARLAGKVDFAVIEALYGCSPLSLLCEAALEPVTFKQRKIIAPVKFARYVYFFTRQEGLIKHIPDLSILYQVKSVASVFFAFDKGDMLRPTSKAFKSKRPGYAYLVADSKQQLEKDYLALRVAEQKLYAAILED